MLEASPLSAWEAFYVIVGSSSAALTGLVFVVITLMPEARIEASELATAAFASPTVSHLIAGLMVSAILSAPWHEAWQAGIAVALSGIIGAIYCAIVFRRIRRQAAYQTVGEDWFWYFIAPLVAYMVLLGGGIAMEFRPVGALFAVGGAVLLLLFAGIHNAWDMVTFTARTRMQPTAPTSPRSDESA